jgi:hypothetical protein
MALVPVQFPVALLHSLYDYGPIDVLLYNAHG